MKAIVHSTLENALSVQRNSRSWVGYFLWMGFLVVGISTLQGQAVDGSNADEEWRNPTNYGLKMGLAINSFIPGELQNPRPSVGFMTGVYKKGQTSAGPIGDGRRVLIYVCGAAILPMQNCWTACPILHIPKLVW